MRHDTVPADDPTSTPPEGRDATGVPDWVPQATRAYLAHACAGQPLRHVASAHGCAPSTVLRQVRRIEARRDDPLFDDMMDDLAAWIAHEDADGVMPMSAMPQRAALIDDQTLEMEARRILRRLCEGEAVLVVGQGMDQAVVLRSETDPTRIATLSRAVAQAFVLKEWIGCHRAGRVTRYRITDAGRAALRRLLSDKLARKIDARGDGAPSAAIPGGTRINLAESPLGVLARRRDRDGSPFLSSDLVMAGERLREDYEVAQATVRDGQDWERFLTDDGADDAGGQDRSAAARARVAEALRFLGPGLGDVALRVCCYLEGIEVAEKRMGWAARSGKIVLRIALQRLATHYQQA